MEDLGAAIERAWDFEDPAGSEARLRALLTDADGQDALVLRTQVARALGISVKTADRHVQNAYGKIGVSTRAAATLFAMEHGLVAWGEFPIAGSPVRS